MTGWRGGEGGRERRGEGGEGGERVRERGTERGKRMRNKGKAKDREKGEREIFITQPLLGIILLFCFTIT